MIHLICLGNALHADDGFGAALAHRLGALVWPDNIRVLNGSGRFGPVDLFEHCRLALVLEAVPAHFGAPGEIVRLDGAITCFGLNLVKFTTEQRLDEIIRVFEANGCPIFNPHRCTLEEGGMKQTDAVQLAFKREADPQGLLNPGKMIAWENPDYDYRSGRTFLFKGLERAG